MYDYTYALKPDPSNHKRSELSGETKHFHKQPAIQPKPTKRVRCSAPPRPSKRVQTRTTGELTVCPQHYADRKNERTVKSKRLLFKPLSDNESDMEDYEIPSASSEIGLLSGKEWDVEKLAKSGNTFSVRTTELDDEIEQVVEKQRIGVGSDGRPARITTKTTTTYKRVVPDEDYVQQPPVKRREGREFRPEDLDDMTYRLNRILRR